MKRSLYALLFTTLLAGSVASCGNSDNSASNDTSSPSVDSTGGEGVSSVTSGQDDSSSITYPDLSFDTNQEVEITFYHTMGDNLQRVLDAYLDDFEVIYPNIIVNHRQIGTYDDISDQLVTEISTGASDCDIAYCYPDHIAKYNKAKVVVDLNPYIYNTQTDSEGNLLYGMSEEQINDFVPAYWQEGYVIDNQTMHCLPFSKSTEVLYYDATFFANNNLNVPTHWFNETSTDTYSMEYVMGQIKTIDPQSIPLGYDSSSNWFITMAAQMGGAYTSATGEHFLFNNPTNVSFVNSLKDWYLNGLVTTKDLYGAYTSGLFTADTTLEGTTQRCYMCIGSSAGSTYQVPQMKNGQYPWEVGISPIPQDDPDDGKVLEQGPSICLLNSGDNQKIMASWLLSRFLTTNIEFQCQFSISSGYTPVLKSCNDNEIYKNFLDSANGTSNIAALSTKVCTQQAEWYFTSPAFDGSSEARTAVGNLLTAAMQGNISVEQAFTNAINSCNGL